MKYIAVFVFTFILSVCTQANPLEQTPSSNQSAPVSTIEVSSVKVSPTGIYLAVKTQRFGKATLTFLDRRTLDVLGGLAIEGDKEIGEFYWANDSRVVSEIHQLTGVNKSDYQGELFAVNFDGTQKALLQSRGMKTTSGNMLKIVDALPGNDGHVLVSATPLLSEDGERGIATLLNIYQGIEENHYSFLPDSLAGFYTDESGQINVALTSETEKLHLSDNR